MNTLQIVHALKDVPSFRGAYPSDLLPDAPGYGTYIINLDPHTQAGSHWVAVHILPLRGYYFDSYGLYPPLASILRFLKRHCITWDYNRRQLQGLIADTCGHYACLFALFMDRKHTPAEYVNMFTQQPDVQVKKLFHHWLGPLCNTRGGQKCIAGKC